LLVQASATLGRVANEIYHLQRTEIDEVREGRRAGQVGSSTMPHKQNPSTVDLISALSRLVRAQMVALTDIAEKEAAAEMLLEAKGFTDVVVSISSDGGADVVLDMGEVTDAKRAQVEDIVARKTEVAPENIVITPIAQQ